MWFFFPPCPRFLQDTARLPGGWTGTYLVTMCHLLSSLYRQLPYYAIWEPSDR